MNDSFVGNPLICGSKATDGCFSSAVPIPLSLSVDSPTGKSHFIYICFFILNIWCLGKKWF